MRFWSQGEKRTLFKNIEDKRRYHREYNKRKRRENPEKWKMLDKEKRLRERQQDIEKIRLRERLAKRKWLEKNPEKKQISTRNSQLRRYGLTIEQYTAMRISQGDCCAICKEFANGKTLSVDHNHITGQVRSLLCSKCNTGLGMFRENKQLLQNTIDYLKRYEERI